MVQRLASVSVLRGDGARRSSAGTSARGAGPFSQNKGPALTSFDAMACRRVGIAQSGGAIFYPLCGGAGARADLDTIPDYLRAYYWWAYIHPYAVEFFERQWLVNLILWGNYARLRDAALDELGQTLPGRTLQVACAYGDLSVRLAERVSTGQGSLDVVDVLPIQLQNLRKKLPAICSTRLLQMDSANLRLPDASYDRVLVFFLLHEQPPHVRLRTLQEAWRVVKPGGKIVIVDYAKPRWWHPLRYLWRPLLKKLEPFALDLWREDIRNWLPDTTGGRPQTQSFFGGLYQMVVARR